MIVAVALTLQKQDTGKITTFSYLGISYSCKNTYEALGETISKAFEEHPNFMIVSKVASEVKEAK